MAKSGKRVYVKSVELRPIGDGRERVTVELTSGGRAEWNGSLAELQACHAILRGAMKNESQIDLDDFPKLRIVTDVKPDR